MGRELSRASRVQRWRARAPYGVFVSLCKCRCRSSECRGRGLGRVERFACARRAGDKRPRAVRQISGQLLASAFASCVWLSHLILLRKLRSVARVAVEERRRVEVRALSRRRIKSYRRRPRLLKELSLCKDAVERRISTTARQPADARCCALALVRAERAEPARSRHSAPLLRLAPAFRAPVARRGCELVGFSLVKVCRTRREERGKRDERAHLDFFADIQARAALAPDVERAVGARSCC